MGDSISCDVLVLSNVVSSVASSNEVPLGGGVCGPGQK